jgi:hypothetical protein
MRNILVGILLSLSAPAYALDNECIAGAALHTMDWLQTRQIVRRPGYYENNPILNDRPLTIGRVNTYFAITGTLLYTACELGYGGKWLKYTWIAVESGAVGHNLSIGLQVRW